MNQDIDVSLQTQVDSQLMEQGAFTPLELLLTSGRLVYTDYERWRMGELEFLDEALLGSPKRIRTQVDNAITYAKKIGLVEERQEFSAWNTEGESASLKLSANDTLHQLLSLRFISQQNVPQLDMFFDNPVVVLVNGIAEALIRRSLTDAERFLDQLYQQAPNHSDLAAFDQLVEALRKSVQPVTDPLTELSTLQQLVPNAKRLLSAQCRDFLVPLWRRLAEALDGVGYSGKTPDLHNSYVLAQAQDWEGVSHSILNEAGWWERETLCLRLAECGYLRQERRETLMAWCYLCWINPEEAMAVLDSGEWIDLSTVNLWHQFLELEDELELEEPLSTEEFPAWLLLTEPGLSRILSEELPKSDTRSEQLFSVVHQLVSARLSGNNERELELRKELQTLQPVLVSYLKMKV